MQATMTSGAEEPQPPVLCTRHGDFDIWFEGHGWELVRADAMMAGEENGRYADICGDDIAAMAGVGWQFLAEPVCFTATCETGEVIAIAWAGPMRTEDGSMGCNLSYAVDARYEGHGLAKLLASLAFLACEQLYPGMTFANIETRACNPASVALAGSLGFRHCPDEDFTMPVAGGAEVAFLCFRAGVPALRDRALQLLEARKLHELAALIRQQAAANEPSTKDSKA